MYRYAQHCPVARAAEVLAEPWTVLVLRELLRGGERRSDIAAGVPGMSVSLLTRRLRTLVGHGLVEEVPGRGEKKYRLTEAGRAIGPVVDELGRWGQHWLAPPALADLNADLLLRDICVQMADRLPDRPLTVEVKITDAPSAGRWWLLLAPTDAVVQDTAPAWLPDVRLVCTLSGLAGVWSGKQRFSDAVREQTVVFAGPSDAVRSLVTCIGVDRYVDVVREPV
ncbi:MAG: helix-turn-helix domain-containing protein [Actinophytocola sp.]|uniref:winged helix-turn-helix transcriptional regulator n=1 Tax=Actinophytocola sp. TaxID=1872138 RepID=UPI003C718715